MAAETGALTDGLIYGQLEPLGRWRVAFGYGVFVTTATTATVYCPFQTLACAVAAPFFSAAAAAANGQLTVTGTISADKTLAVTSNQVTVARAAGTDSALAFFVVFIGR